MPWSPALKSSLRSGLHLERTVNEPLQVLRGMLGVGIVLFGALWLGRPSLATSAALGAFIAGTATYQRSFRPRPILALYAAAGLAASSFVGYLASPWPPLFVLVLALWAFAAGLAWVLGQTAGVVASTTVSVMLIIVTLPENVAQAAEHAGYVAAGGLVQATLAAVWPGRRWAARRDALADAYASLADYARRLRHDPFAAFDPDPLMNARRAAALSPAQARRRPAELAGMRSYAERIRPVLAAMADPRVGADEEGPQRDRARELMGAAAEMLDAVARSIRTGRPAAVPERTYRALTVPKSGPVLEGAGRQAALKLIGLLAEAADAVDAVDRGDPVGGGAAAPGHLPRPSLRQLLPALLHALRRHWDWSSPVLRHAVRLAVVAALGEILGRSLPVSHGYWAPMTAVMVIRPDFSQTYTRGVARVAGTVLGVAVTTAIILATHPSVWICAALAVLSIGGAYLLMRSGYAAMSTCITGYVVFLLAMDGTGITSTVADRVLLTLLGGLIALAAYAVFPTWQTVRLPDRLAAYVEAGGAYAAAAVDAYAEPSAKGPAVVREALLGYRQTRSELGTASDQAAVEPVRHRGLGTAQLADARAAMAALGRAVMLMEAHLPAADAQPVPGAARFAAGLREQTARAARQIRAGGPVDLGPVRAQYEEWARELPAEDSDPASASPGALLHRDAGLLAEALEGLSGALADQ
ncbi:FUSC family protein [Streptacidiphilus sp. PB12-B1b]|uniref:FUSC family protein n=1 Tax=Streptacidiphilus sp. PB12-B1b TaxID=2705012 RepID=UPI0015F93B3F|nr:FUSC family protein [Streptacidiphilus sp. PB12-B1b]QMU76489.1 FUSC family protein [Streptacidiphilus sp. PB12-B1b]